MSAVYSYWAEQITTEMQRYFRSRGGWPAAVKVNPLIQQELERTAHPVYGPALCNPKTREWLFEGVPLLVDADCRRFAFMGVGETV